MTPELRAECHEYAASIVAALPPITDAMAEQAAQIIAGADHHNTEGN